VLIGIGIFTYLSYSGDAHHHRRYTRYLSIISSVLIGIGLALFSTAVLTDTSRLLGHSSWTLPLLLFLLLIRRYPKHRIMDDSY
jgi:F0F1-type ATP synthase assembly protein I